MKPSLFIGSSVEALDVAYAVQQNLEYVTQPTVWDQGIFHLSKSAATSLLQHLEESDFGIFVFTPDDSINIRGDDKSVTRDNVILELGLFLGRLGAERSFMFMPRDQSDSFHLPTDLVGFTPATYDAQRPDNNLRAATGPACNQVREAIRSLGPRSRSSLNSDEPQQDKKSAESNPVEVVDSAQTLDVQAEARDAPSEQIVDPQRSPFDEMIAEYIFGDKERGDKAYEAARDDAEGDSEQQLRVEATYAYLRYGAGEVAAFYKLQNLREQAKEYPTVLPLVHNWVGLAYEKGEDPVRAHQAFEAAAEAAVSEQQRVSYVASAARSLFQAGQQRRALDRLTDEIDGSNSDEPLSTLYKALAELYEKLDRQDLTAIALQKATEYRPNDTDVRFSAAYSSSASQFSALALLHYLALLKFDPENYAALNNVGIEYGEWDMPVRQVSSYKKAVEKGNTLAAANLAREYMNAGFVTEAREVLHKAKEQEDFHPNVGSALAALSRREQVEADLEAGALSAAGEQRRFLISFAEAYFVRNPSASRFDGSWCLSTGEEAAATHSGTILEIKWERNNSDYVIVAETRNRAALVSKYERKEQFYSPSLGDKGYALLSEDNQVMKIMILKDKRHSFLTLKRTTNSTSGTQTSD